MSKENEGEGKNVLENFSREEQETIGGRQRVLSTLAHFLGKNFDVPIELGTPGKGWGGDVNGTTITADPNDLAQESLNTLRYKVSSQAGRVRISRLSDIPKAQWDELGYQFLTNTVEQARSTTFVAENYPRAGENLDEAARAGKILNENAVVHAKAKLGFVPRFLQAGNELTRQWHNELSEQPHQVTDKVGSEVKSALKKMERGAHDAWWTYPSKKEADQGEHRIRRYADRSRHIVNTRVWPEFKKLMEEDLQDAQMQEMLKQMMQSMPQGTIPKDLDSQLDQDERQNLLHAMMGASESSPGGSTQNPVDLESLPDELKRKLQEYLNSLPTSQKAQLAQMAKNNLKSLEQFAQKDIESLANETPDKKAQPRKSISQASLDKGEGREAGNTQVGGRPTHDPNEQQMKEFRKQLEAIAGVNKGVYENIRDEMLPAIDKLENLLRDIFVRRRAGSWKSGFSEGRRVNITKRIQEKVGNVSVFESKAWKRKELPSEKDYAISLLVDITTSMLEGDKLMQTFKSVVVIVEALNRLSINLEITGFNSDQFVFKAFHETMSNQIRRSMSNMLEIPVKMKERGIWGTATGWAVQESASRLQKQKEKVKILIVLTDGRPDLPKDNPKNKFDLKMELSAIKQAKRIRVIGGGIGHGSQFVEGYFEESFFVEEVQEMPQKLADVVFEAINDN